MKLYKNDETGKIMSWSAMTTEAEELYDLNDSTNPLEWSEYYTELDKEKDHVYRVVIVEPHKPARLMYLEDTLESLQKAVQGYIEFSYPSERKVVFIGNDEAKLIGMEATLKMNREVYCGPIIIAGEDESNEESGICDISKDDEEYFMKKFAEPEDIDFDDIAKSILGLYFGF